MAEITTDRQLRLELVKNAVIYQINLRVFTKEGTLAALYFVGGAVLFLFYALFHIILYFLPVLFLAALVCFLAYLACQVWKVLNN